MHLHTRVGKNPWSAQMPNCTTICTHVFSMKEAACTVHCAARNNRCKRQRPLWNHLDQRTWLSVTGAPTDLACLRWSAGEMGLKADHRRGLYGCCSRWSHLLLPSRETKGSWGGHRTKRWVMSKSFLVGADKSLWTSGNVEHSKNTRVTMHWWMITGGEIHYRLLSAPIT